MSRAISDTGETLQQGEEAAADDEIPKGVRAEGGPEEGEMGSHESVDRDSGYGATGRGGRSADWLHLRTIGGQKRELLHPSSRPSP